MILYKRGIIYILSEESWRNDKYLRAIMNEYSLSCLLSLFSLNKTGTRKMITLTSLNHSCSTLSVACHGPKKYNRSKRLEWKLLSLCTLGLPQFALCVITGVLISLKRDAFNFFLAKRIKLTLILHFSVWLSYLFANSSVKINLVSVKFQILCTSYNEKWSYVFP